LSPAPLSSVANNGHVEDIAPMVAFIAGPDSGYITGASLTIDGGTNA
jgi:3-oxoacyl-[acyl-carrier protein] reductase